jgi:DNA-binding transcriptional ArsR family regulator
VAKQSNLARKQGPAAVDSSSREAGPVKAARVPEFDKLIHERMRLAIVSALAANDSMTFSDLKKLLETTDGNLSIHARKLEEAGYISCAKSFEGRVPKTEYRITETGLKAFRQWLDHMEALVVAMKGPRGEN